MFDGKQRKEPARLPDPSFESIATLFFTIVTGSYAIGTFGGKLLAWLLGKDRSAWGDMGGIVGGLFGLSVFLSVVIVIFRS
jgi:hypothetical protein